MAGPDDDAQRRDEIQTYALDPHPRSAATYPWLLSAARVPGPASPRSAESVAPALVARAIADGHPPRFTPATIVQLQRTIGNAGVTRLLVARCPDGEVPPEGCVECGRPPVQRAVRAPGVQRQAGGRPTIRLGSKGAVVSELQKRLVDAGASIEVDGAFGGRTLKAVKAAQGAAGLTADGIVGPRTWGAIDAGVRLPGGGTPPRGYAELLERVRTAIGAIRGGGPAGPGAAPVLAIGTQVQRQDEDDEDDSLWDQATEAASGAWDAATEQAGSAVDYGSEQAGQAWDYASEQAGEAWDAASGAAGEAWEAGSEAAGAAWEQAEEAAGGAVESVADTGEQLWEGASQVVESFADEVAGIPGAIRERFGSEIGALEGVIAGLGSGFRLTDDEIAAMTEIVTGLTSGLELDVGATNESTCAAATQAVAFSTPAFSVSFEGLEDLNKKVSGKLGGVAGHVNLAAFPKMDVTCWDGTGPSRTVGAAKITAKGSATFPTPAEPDEAKWKTQSADRPREITGIKDYFSIIKAHEGEHVRIYKDAFSGAPDELKGLTESEAKTKFNSIVCGAFRSQDSLDKSEGCVEVVNGKDANKAGASACNLTPNAAKSCP